HFVVKCLGSSHKQHVFTVFSSPLFSIVALAAARPTQQKNQFLAHVPNTSSAASSITSHRAPYTSPVSPPPSRAAAHLPIRYTIAGGNRIASPNGGWVAKATITTMTILIPDAAITCTRPNPLRKYAPVPV